MKKIILFFVLPFFSLTAISQNIGIGTTTPSGKLDIRHTSSISDPTLILYDNSPFNYARLQLQNASGNKYWHVAGYIDDVTNANSRLNFFHSVTGDVMSLTGDGKMGIGTINPSEKLSVLTGNSSYGFSHSNGTIKLASFIGSGTGFFGTVSNHPLSFFTNDNVVTMYLNTSGNVGIGSVTPAHRTHIAANSVHAGLVQLNLEETEEDYARLRFQNTVASRYWEIGALPKTVDADATMNFYYNNYGVVLSLSGNGTVTANNYNYSTPKTRVYSLGGVDFSPINNIDNFAIPYVIGSISMNSSSNPLVAPIHLPHGSVITSFIVYYYDNHVSENLDVRFFKSDGVNIASLIAQTISSGMPGNSLMLQVAISEIVNNSSDFYYIVAGSSTGTWTANTLRINRVQINYTIAGTD
jgi:hypothetical protein